MIMEVIESIDPRYLLVKVAEVLDELSILYAVTGGMAVYVWGRPRFTADIDIVIQLREKDVECLALALEKLSKVSYVDTHTMRWALERHGEFNFIDGVSGIKVDFWVLAEGEFEESQLKRRVGKEVLGRTIFFVSPEDLILSKLRWHKEGGSSRQLEDVESIFRFNKKLDFRYLRKWAKIHDTIDILESLLKSD